MPTPPQEPTPRLRKLDSLFSGRMSAEDKIISGVIKEMLSGSDDLAARLTRRIARLDLDSQGNVKQTNKNLREIEKINMLIDQATSLITRKAIKSLSNQTEELNDFYEAEIKAVEPSITKKRISRLVDSNQTRAVLNTNLDNMKSVSTSLASEMRRQLTASLFENIGPEEMAESINELLEGKKDKRGNPMTRHGETLARTAYNGYANALTLQNVNLDEVVAYYYSGPEDRRNRTFCAKRVEKVQDKETLESDIKAQSGGTLHNPGGFNCRHKLFPISMFDDEGEPFLSPEQKAIVSGVEVKKDVAGDRKIKSTKKTTKKSKKTKKTTKK